jgi:hypothetical protein
MSSSMSCEVGLEIIWPSPETSNLSREIVHGGSKCQSPRPPIAIQIVAMDQGYKKKHVVGEPGPTSCHWADIIQEASAL